MGDVIKLADRKPPEAFGFDAPCARFLTALEILAADYEETGGLDGALRALSLRSGCIEPEDMRAMRCICVALDAA